MGLVDRLLGRTPEPEPQPARAAADSEQQDDPDAPENRYWYQADW